MNAHVLETINSFYRLSLDRLFVKVKVFARKGFFFFVFFLEFYKFIDLSIFSVLFVLNYFCFKIFDI